VEFEGGSAADDQVMAEQRLQRDDGLLPGEFAARPLIDPSCRLGEPAGSNVLAAQTCRVAITGEPCSVDQQPLGKVALQPVYGILFLLRHTE